MGGRGGEKRCALGPQVGIEPAVAAGRPVNVLVVLVGGATAPPDCILVGGVCGRRGAGDRGSDRSEPEDILWDMNPEPPSVGRWGRVEGRELGCNLI